MTAEAGSGPVSNRFRLSSDLLDSGVYRAGSAIQMPFQPSRHCGSLFFRSDFSQNSDGCNGMRKKPPPPLLDSQASINYPDPRSTAKPRVPPHSIDAR